MIIIVRGHQGHDDRVIHDVVCALPEQLGITICFDGKDDEFIHYGQGSITVVDSQ